MQDTQNNKMMLSNHIADLIITKMQDLNLTYDKIGLACSTSKQSVMKWANGSIPSSEYIEQLCIVLKVTPYELLNIKAPTNLSSSDIEILDKVKSNPVLKDIIVNYKKD